MDEKFDPTKKMTEDEYKAIREAEARENTRRALNVEKIRLEEQKNHVGAHHPFQDAEKDKK